MSHIGYCFKTEFIQVPTLPLKEEFLAGTGGGASKDDFKPLNLSRQDSSATKEENNNRISGSGG